MRINTVLISFAVGIAGAMPMAASAQIDSLSLSLDQCISIALSDNPTIHINDMEIKRLDYSKKETIGQLLPSIGFNGTYSRTLAKQTMYMNMKGFGAALGGGAAAGDSASGEDGEEGEQPQPAPQAKMPSSNGGIKVGLDNSYSVGFQASMPIIAPQLWKTLKLSDTNIVEALEKSRSSKLDLVNQVKNAYYTLLLTLDSYEVIQESYDMAKFTADLYAKKYQLGAASQYDVLRTEVALKNVEPELTQATIAVRQANLQLLILMGMDSHVAIKPENSLNGYKDTMYDSVLAMDASIDNNSNLRMLDIQTRKLKDALSIQKMAWYPTLALTANYNWTSMQDGSPFKGFRWSPYSMVGLSLSLPIFEGGQRYSRIKQASLQVDEMKWQRDNLVRSIRMQSEIARENIQLNVKQINSCTESVMQAEKAHDILRKSFEIGAASYLDLRDSELALTRSRLAYYQSIYNYLVASSNLELLHGTADIEKYTETK